MRPWWMRRRLASSLVLGLALLSSREAFARPNVEITTTIGGADASEYLARVENPGVTTERGVLELRRPGDEHVVARAPFEVPAKATRYFRMPAEKGQRLDAFAITSTETVRARERFGNEGSIVLFDIPPRDDHRLRELRAHTSSNATITHAMIDEQTQAPVLTRRAGVYEGVTLVLVPSGVFVGLPALERQALMDWVRTGGSIALSIDDPRDLPGLAELVPDPTKLRPASFGTVGDVGLGHVHVLPMNPWSVDAHGDIPLQEKLVALAEHDRAPARFNGPWADAVKPALDPNQSYRSVMALAGVLLVVQALVTAVAFRRLALRRGMGPAYRFVVGSSAAGFAAVIGLGLYAKGGFGPRAREVSFEDAASGESVAWVERNRAFYASDARTIDVAPTDPSNLVSAHDSHAVFRVDHPNASDPKDANVVLTNITVRPWQATAVTERGTTTIGGGVRLEYDDDGNVVVRNATGVTLRNVVVSGKDGACLAFGDIESGAAKTSTTPHRCNDLGPAWEAYRDFYPSPYERQLFTPRRLTLLGELDQAPGSVSGFRLEKRTTLLRVTGGAS